MVVTAPEVDRTDLMNPEQYPSLSVETARTLYLPDMGQRQAYDAARRGDIPAVKIGRRWYVKHAELRRMLGLDAD